MAILIWKRAQVEGLILRERSRERESADKEWMEKIHNALNEQRAIHELQDQSKNAEISMLTKEIDRSKRRLIESGKKEESAKKILLTAQSIIAEVDHCYREHAEGEAILMTDIHNIKNRIDIFGKDLLTEGK